MPSEKSKGKKGETDGKDKAAGKKADRVAAGDIITLDFDAWILHPDGNEELFDTTDEEHARAGDIFDEKARYGPITTVVGDGRVLPGLDKSFQGAVVGEKTKVDIPPEEGAGERQPNLIEIFSLRELQRQDIDPQPGMRVHIKNRMGTITNVTSGRVRVDFNDPLAGKTLRYEYTIHSKASTPEEKVLGILEADYGRSGEFGVKVEGDCAEIVLADICKYDQAWFTLKYKVVSDLRQHLDLKNIRFVEEYARREEPASDDGEQAPEADSQQENEPDEEEPAGE